MFLKQEKPEMGDFEEENFVGAKMSQNICYRTFDFFLFEKKMHFLAYAKMQFFLRAPLKQIQ